MKKHLIAVIILILISSTCWACDRNREGFLNGFGVGIENASEGIAIKTNIKFGRGFSDYFQMAVSNRMAWLPAKNQEGLNVVEVSGILIGAEACWFPRLFINRFFLIGGGGFEGHGTPFEDENKPNYGFGTFGGLGYEFTKSFSIEAGISPNIYLMFNFSQFGN